MDMLLPFEISKGGASYILLQYFDEVMKYVFDATPTDAAYQISFDEILAPSPEVQFRQVPQPDNEVGSSWDNVSRRWLWDGLENCSSPRAVVLWKLVSILKGTRAITYQVLFQ